MTTLSARQVLIDRVLNLRDTLIARPGPVALGNPYIQVRVTPERREQMLALARERATPRAAAYLADHPELGLQTLVLDTLGKILSEAGHTDIAALDDFKLGQAFRLVIDEAGDVPRLALESLSGERSLPLGDLGAEFLEGFTRHAAYAVESSVRHQAMLLSPAELIEGLIPEVMHSRQSSQGHLSLHMADAPGERAAPLPNGPWRLRWRASDALVKHVAEEVQPIYGAEWSNYYLELTPSGRLFLKYQQIIGSREIARLTPDEIQAVFVARRNVAVLAAAEALRQIGDNPRPHQLPDILTAPARPAAPRVEAPVPAAEPAAEAPAMSTVQWQLAQMRAEGDRILLPEFYLSEYQEIRTRMLNAGFTYKKKGGVCFFQGHEGVDAAAVLAQLVSGDRVNIQQETQFFGTPAARAEEVVREAGIAAGHRVLEPSAGNGALADPARAAGAEVITIENWDVNARALRAKGYEPVERDFLEVSVDDIGGLVDAVTMNPPFTKGQDMRHVQHALGFLLPDGVLVAITSSRVGLNSTKAHKAFAQLLDLADAERTEIPAGEFSASGTEVATSQIRIEMSKLLAAIDAQPNPIDTELALGIDLGRTRLEWARQAADCSDDRPRERG
jgi:predicted RNA methylase